MAVLGDLLRFLSIFCAGIATGTWVVTQRALIPVRRELQAAAAIHLHVATSREIDRYQPACAAVATVSGFLLLVLRLTPDRTAALWTMLGCACLLGASLTSLSWNMPINRRIASWPPGSAPAEYPALQQKWNQGNVARTLMGLVGFTSYVIAATGSFRGLL